MAVYSMTGYANVVAGPLETPVTQIHPDTDTARTKPRSSGAVNVEMRSVNGRFLDLSLRLPDELRSLEPALRELVGKAFRRGKIEVRIGTRVEADGAWPKPLPDQLSRLASLEGVVHGWLPEARPLSVHEALQWCKGAAPTERVDDEALDAARRCVDGLRAARAREGERLVAVLDERVGHLRKLANRAEPLVPVAVSRQQERFVERWHDALATTGAEQSISRQALEERAVNEAAAFAIRVDVAEELARLRAHLDEIDRLLKAGGEVGKRLDFLIQELLREANTLGSKASSIELTGVSVDMKVAIEQMREQVQNLE